MTQKSQIELYHLSALSNEMSMNTVINLDMQPPCQVEGVCVEETQIDTIGQGNKVNMNGDEIVWKESDLIRDEGERD